ncbi:hypothetical protein [Citromicrobium bathyomarinum]|uniref:hypothetical protein n=1 Tax=Citromicrobium bathyomarinum TaxID=72174 RepID=UPI00315A1F57
MSFLSVGVGAVLALALQASGSTTNVETDAGAVADVCISLATPDTEGMSEDEWKAFIGCIFRETAAQIDPQLPMKLDDTTSIVAISATGARLNYTYVVNRAASDFSPSQKEYIATSARKSVCGDPDMLATLNRGGSYFYRWLDRSGAVLQTALIDRC